MKLILVSFLLACVGYALAGYGSGTPGYYDPWTYYGGYSNGNNYNYPRSYYPISGGSGGYGYNRQQPRPYNSANRYVSGGRGPYGRSYGRTTYGRTSYGRASYGDYDY